MNAMLPIMPGLPEVPVTREQRLEKSGSEDAGSSFTSMFAGLFSISLNTPAAVAEDNPGTADSNPGTLVDKETAENKPGADPNSSLVLFDLMSETLPVAAPQSMPAGNTFGIFFSGFIQPSKEEHAAATYTLADGTGQAEVPPSAQMTMTEAASVIAAVSSVPQGVTPPPEVSGSADRFGTNDPTAVSSAVQPKGADALDGGFAERTESYAAANVQLPEGSGRNMQSGTPSVHAKGIVSDSGSSVEKTVVYPAESLLKATEDTTLELTPALVSSRIGNAKDDAGSGTSAAGRNTNLAFNAPGSENVIEASEAALKPDVVTRPESEPSEKVRAEGIDHKNIRSTTSETPVVSDGRVAGVDAAVRSESIQRLHEAVEVPRTIRVQDQVFQVTKVNASSLELTVQPEGLGKLDIEVNLSSGQIHARISASDVQTRNMLEQNLPDIMNALAADGHMIGGLSIGLRDGREQMQQGPSGQQRSEAQKVTEAAPLPVRSANSNIVSIFV
ncbi:MAG: hypothetical protein C0402_14725 [Thermodesulfovibrio sp.]|nr:hypothetical protein [Thermodesulfovibrio sp.]